jgi:hypothetical protein
VLVESSVRSSVSGKKTEKQNWIKAAFVAVAALTAAGAALYFGTALHAAKASGPAIAGPGIAGQGFALPEFAGRTPDAHNALIAKAFSLPLFFEPNQGQTAPPVKFLAHGAGYSLFLTADQAVLDLQRSVKGKPSSGSVIRMQLEGASSSAKVSGASPLPGKSSYFIGNDPSKWHRDIPQFARVEYQAVYPGVDLVYYGNQGQLEYDFRVAPAADPNQIAMSFEGASARIVPATSGNDSGNDAGDLILTTANGEVRFHAPHVYQPATPAGPQSRESSGNASAKTEKTVAGAFRQLAGNKIGFTIGDYDHSRELIIDPTLSYSTYFGGNGIEGPLTPTPGNLVAVAVDSALNIYLAGATNSTVFPGTSGPIDVAGGQNIFISKINPGNAGTPVPQLVYSIILGGMVSGEIDSLAGLAVDSNYDIYVAGSTNSSTFPTTSNAFQTVTNATFPGTHGFVSEIGAVETTFNPPTLVYTLDYSTYLAGNGEDNITGLAIDTSNQYVYVTGNTTSNNPASNANPFPANPNNAYQLASNAPLTPQGQPQPGYPQFFATKLNTASSGVYSLIYSTYLGGSNPAAPIANGGGIAVDPSGNMYITGTTNMLPTGINGGLGFPLVNAFQSCLNQSGINVDCISTPTSNTDAFVAKINPQLSGMGSLVYSTYVGAEGQDTGTAIAVDSSSNAYITGATNSLLWVCSCAEFQGTLSGTNDAFIAKIPAQLGPLSYFTYIGGTGSTVGNAIQVDSLQAAHVTGYTSTGGLLTVNPIQPGTASSYNGVSPAGGGDAFVALISTNGATGNYLTYLGGNQQDQGTGIALDTYGAAYVAGNTLSPNFPVTSTAYQSQLNGTFANAFVSKLGAVSVLSVTQGSSSPSPNPVAAGTQVTFTFDIENVNPNGPTDPATFVVFDANVPITGNSTTPTAKVTSGSGNCGSLQGTTIPCFIPTLAVGATATVEVEVTPIINAPPPTPPVTSVAVSGIAAANGGPFVASNSQQVPVVDFTVQASTSNPSVTAGQQPPPTVNVTFCPTATSIPLGGYSGTITPSQSTSPSMVTSPAPSFNPTSVTLSGSACGTTILTIPTVARPVTNGSLLRRGSFYAAWLPIGGLSLVGLGIGAAGRRRRRRWLAGAVLGLIAGMILLLPSCGTSSTATATPGGTAAGVYTITITGSAGNGASHSQEVSIRVN